MWTTTLTRDGAWLTTVDGNDVPSHLKIRIPPAWTSVRVNTDANADCLVMGRDGVGRVTRMYSAAWIAKAKGDKFDRVRQLLSEHDDVRHEIEATLNNEATSERTREAATVAYLILETGIRPGSTSDTLAKVKAYGATTLQLRHIKQCPRGVRLQFVGKKGVAQNVLVTNPYLVRVLLARKAATTSYTTDVFRCSASLLNAYIATLGSGDYTAKDFRTALGTKIATTLVSERKTLPATASKRKALLNSVLDVVAAQLGNTRAVCKSSYVDPTVIERLCAV